MLEEEILASVAYRAYCLAGKKIFFAWIEVDEEEKEKWRAVVRAILVVQDQDRPRIVCLCGSTRFTAAFRAANLHETLEGHIVLSIGCDTKSDEVLAKEAGITIDKEALDALHFEKIKLADEVLILNVGGYIGESTSRELAYAHSLGKHVRFLEEPSS